MPRRLVSTTSATPAGPLFAANVPAPTIAAILRHADVRTTLTVYAGLVEANRAGMRSKLEAALSAVAK